MVTLTSSKYQLTEYALEVLASNLTEEELEGLFEDSHFSPELEEYLFECMDNSKDQSYVEVVRKEITNLFKTQVVLNSL